jgi:hypothetical protein
VLLGKGSTHGDPDRVVVEVESQKSHCDRIPILVEGSLLKGLRETFVVWRLVGKGDGFSEATKLKGIDRVSFGDPQR